MKSTLVLLAITLGFYSASAQDFKATEKYTLMNERVIDQDEESGRGLIDLVPSDDTSNTIATLNITELELLEEVHISLLTAPNLEDITEILKVELAYSACCTSTDTYYFLVSDDKNLVALPRIENLYCEGAETDTHYIFPSQIHGQEGTILRAEQHYTETYTVKAIEVIQSFVWKDDDFDYEEAISAIK
jgi:hypothetical protein